jgi:NTE family protein
LRQSVIKAALPRRALLAASALALLLAGAPAPAGSAEPPEEAARPRVGLVLSGGGARGFAHVGVLQVLEELRVPVDYIAGTSMGALVGGLYASGMSTRELEHVVTEGIDWTTAFDDVPPRRERSFRRKQDDFDFLTNLRLYVKDFKVALPKGLIEGQKISNILGVLTLPAATLRDFDALPVPFRAVATDANSGEAVVLDQGHLARALRASMAIPGIFSPVEMDDLTLVDGGVSMNLPVDVVKQMGADVVIAVDISTGPAERLEEASVLSISGQMLSVLMQRNTLEQIEQLGERDLLIQPDLAGITSGSFEKGAEGIARGLEAARAMSEALSRLAVSPEAYAGYRERWDALPREAPVIDRVRFDNRSHLSTEVIRRRVHAEAGRPLDAARLQADLDTLYGEGVFDRAIFSIDEVEGQRELVIHTVPKGTGKHFLRFGLNLDTNFQAESAFNLAVLATSMPLNGLGAEWRSRFQIGDESEFRTEFFQPVGYGRHLFVAPELRIGIENLNIFVDDDRVATYDESSLVVGGSLGWQFGNWGEVRAGLAYVNGEFERKVGDPELPTFDFAGGAALVSLSVDTLDSVRFPRRGGALRLEGEYVSDALGSKETLILFEAGGSHAFSFGKNTIIPVLKYATSWAQESDLDTTPVFSLGGFLRLSGLVPDQRTGPHLVFGSLVGYRRVANPRFLMLALPIYVGGSIEAGNTFESVQSIRAEELTVAGSVFLGIDTPLGPLYVGYGVAEGGHDSGYLRLGQVF